MGEMLAFAASAVFVVFCTATITLAAERQRNRILNFLCIRDYSLADLRIAMSDIDEQRMRALLKSLVADGRVRAIAGAYDTLYALNLPKQELVL